MKLKFSRSFLLWSVLLSMLFLFSHAASLVDDDEETVTPQTLRIGSIDAPPSSVMPSER
jgi:hypothetical protein